MNVPSNQNSDFLSASDTPDAGDDDFLAIDLATAHIFLDIAEMTRDPERARKNVDLAREALQTIAGYFATTERDGALHTAREQSRQQLQVRLAALERRWGVPFTPGNRCAG